MGDPVGPVVGDIDASNVNSQSMMLNSFFSVVIVCGTRGTVLVDVKFDELFRGSAFDTYRPCR